MKKSRLHDEQIVWNFRETYRHNIAKVANRQEGSEIGIYRWRKKFGDLQTDEVRRLKGLVAESARLCKLFADRDVEIEAMKRDQGKKWRAHRLS